MPLSKKEMAMLRKQYPAEHYSIKEENGKLEVTPKKVVIRLFKNQAKKIRLGVGVTQGDTFSEDLGFRIQNSKLTPEDFGQCQVTVEKKVADLLTKEAKRCKTRKIIYLQKLLGGI